MEGERTAGLADGLLPAGFATKDFSLLHTGRAGIPGQRVPGLGVRYSLPGGRHVLEPAARRRAKAPVIM
ncbi:hypothetical protein GCM10010345_84140 [Streptomyces canarius]|uniref:Uncharacterized protein n=1 Tax=Streptomyces canarius TaxID=285453 RepID=A0ABQ3DAQ4_9ACTN|nr:hypothetical protein GCM10010345_84140 [Streptomyces canarius]